MASARTVRGGLFVAACAVVVVAQLWFVGGASATTFNANAGALGPIPDGTGPIPSFGPARDVTIPVSGLPTGADALNVAVTFTAQHAWVGDLSVELVAPDGVTKTTIFSRTGAPTVSANGSAADLGGTYTFTDYAATAPTWWTAAAGAGPAEAVPDGVYRASTAGGAGGTGANTTITPAFSGVINPNGNWTLRVRDGAAGDTGQIDAASLTLTTAVPATAGSLGAIPDGTLDPDFGPPRDVTFPISGIPHAPLSDVTLSMTLTHSFVGDVEAVLIAPDGVTQTTIFSRTGSLAPSQAGDASDLAGTYRFFDSSLNDWWTAANTADPTTAIAPGNYRASAPRGSGGGGALTSMSTPFAGVTNPNGIWTLRLRDHQAIDTGSITAASLRLLPTLDTTAPAEPTFSGTDPASPSSSNTPAFQGTAEAGGTVRLYRNGSCAGVPATTGSAAQFSGAGIPLGVPENSESTVTATVFDTSGNVSTCSDPFAFTEDSVAPATPTLDFTDPASPANNHLPKFKGTTEAGSTVRFYDNVDCTGPAAATRPASDLNGAGAEIEVPENETTTVRVTATDEAGNVSGCSAPISYTEDSTSALPTGLTTDPASPANDNLPKLKGVGADPDAVIVGYFGTVCTGPGDFDGTAAALHGAGIPFSAAADATTTFVVESFDAAENGSGCSSPVTYVEDSTAPAAPSLSGTEPGATANQNSPRVKGSVEAGAQVRLFDSADCSAAPIGTGSAVDLAGGGVAAAVPDDATTQIRATATDAAGNASACSAPIAYTEDSKAPETSATTAKKKVTAKKKTAKVKFALSSPEPSATFECRIDKDDFAACGTSVRVKLKKGKHTLTAAAIDSAGNRDATPAEVSVKVKRKRG